jgi:GNAT superfamily N-acetyltransferase
VRQEAQRRGAGRAMVEAAAAEARRRGLPAVTLTTFRSIPFNAPFYARLDFGILADEQLNPRLRAVLADEAARGLADRCAMRRAL